MLQYQRRLRFALVACVAALAAAATIVACGGSKSGTTATPTLAGTPQPTLPTGAMRLTSSEFRNNGKIPQLYTCEGSNNTPPPLSISDVPTTAVSLALTVFDLDAGIAHWLVWNLPPTATTLPDDIKPPVVEGQAFPSRVGYFGPCPPSGTHHYVFTLYALDTTLSIDASTLYQQVIDAMEGHIIEAAQLTGTYDG
jgi:Raf kinase inhibitor-like YbhB/YbcL family protein